MNSFGKIKKQLVLFHVRLSFSCLIRILHLLVSFEHDYDNPDVIGINLINQTHSVRML